MDVQYQVLEGDPSIVRTKGEEYRSIAEAVARSVRTLDNIVEQVEQKSLAMEATRDMASDVAGDIRKITDRYRETGDALVAYAEELQRTKDASRAPAARIAEIEGLLVTARSTLRRRETDYQLLRYATDPDAAETAKDRLDTAQGVVDDLESELATQQSLWQTAHDEKVLAATTAVTRITAVTEGKAADGVNDTFWDHVGRVAGLVWDALKIVCDIAAILSVFLAWVPGLGQVLLVLAAIGAIMSIVDAVVKFAKGEGSLGDLLVAVVVGVLSLYGGKIIGMLAQRLRGSVTLALRPQMGGALVNPSARGALLTRVQTAFPSYGQGTLGFLKSPFVRSPTDMSRMMRFGQGESFGTLLREALKQGNPFNLRNALKFDEDVADVWHIATRYGAYLDDPMILKVVGLGALELGMSVWDVYRSADALTTAVEGGDGFGAVSTGTGHLSGPLPSIVGGGARLTKDVLGLDLPGTG